MNHGNKSTFYAPEFDIKTCKKLFKILNKKAEWFQVFYSIKSSQRIKEDFLNLNFKSKELIFIYETTACTFPRTNSHITCRQQVPSRTNFFHTLLSVKTAWKSESREIISSEKRREHDIRAEVETKQAVLTVSERRTRCSLHGATSIQSVCERCAALRFHALRRRNRYRNQNAAPSTLPPLKLSPQCYRKKGNMRKLTSAKTKTNPRYLKQREKCTKSPENTYDDGDLRTQFLHSQTNTRYETATANWHDHGVEVGDLFDNFQSHCALPGKDMWMVVAVWLKKIQIGKKKQKNL